MYAEVTLNIKAWDDEEKIYSTNHSLAVYVTQQMYEYITNIDAATLLCIAVSVPSFLAN